MRVLVVGGRGHIGGCEMRAVAGVDGPELVAAGRKSRADSVALDLRSPQGFHVVDEFDAVVNCRDTYRLPPGPLATACLERGLIHLEATADTDATLALLGLAIPSDARGAVLLGAGIFPGVSNLLAAEVVRSVEYCDGFELAHSWSALPEAGRGTCEVMVQSHGRPRRFYESSELVEGQPLDAQVSTPYFARSRRGLQLGFPEAIVVPISLDLQASSTVAATRPQPPALIARAAAALAARGAFKVGLVKSMLRIGFSALRSLIIGGRTTNLEMVAIAKRWPEAVAIRALRCDDAFATAGQAIVAKLALLARQRQRLLSGVRGIEQALTLAELLEAMCELGFADLRRCEAEHGF